MEFDWDYRLVGFSMAVGILGSISDLMYVKRMRSVAKLVSCQTSSQSLWWMFGCLKTGITVWALLFTCMHALRLPISISYDLQVSLASMLPAVAGVTLGYYQLRTPLLTKTAIFKSAVLLGTGISVTHYIGMAAMKMSPPIEYSIQLVIVSLLVPVTLLYAALLLIFAPQVANWPTTREARTIAAGIFASFAIISMQYTGIAAATFLPGSICTAVRGILPPETIAIFISVVALVRTAYATLKASIRLVATKMSKQIVAKEIRMDLLLNSLSEGVYGIDRVGRCTFVNRAARRMLGYMREDELIGKEIHGLIHHTGADGSPLPASACQLHAAVLQGHSAETSKEILWRRDATYFPVELRAHPIVEDGEVVGAVTTFLDISARHETDRQLCLMASIFKNANDGVIVTDDLGNIFDVNERFSEVTGYFREEVIGKNCRILQSGRHDQAFYCEMWAAINNHGRWQGEIWNKRKNGEVFPERLSISVVTSAPQGTIHYVAIFTDISEIKRHQDRLEHLAHYDSLTHLPNRTLLSHRIDLAIAQTVRSEQLLAVCYLDVDHFKSINDSHGHEVGDSVLTAVAERLKNAIRGRDTAARLGGDEFVLLIVGLVDLNECEQVLDRILQTISAPLALGGRTFNVTTSIGVTIYPNDDVDPETLLRHADQALYEAKAAGRACHQYFDIGENRERQDRRTRLNEIEQALQREEFCLFYQPKVDMRKGCVIGFEALIRWRHPKFGLLPPAKFLSTVEGTRLEVALGEWVISTSLKQLSAWKRQGITTGVSVNISVYHLAAPRFIDNLKSSLGAYPDISPGALEIEVLENLACADVELVSCIIESCRNLGVEFALDDFGTGYSSLAYFKRLPAQTIKIDQSFVRDMLANSDDLAIVKGIIGLTAAFKRDVIAEGVETIDHGIVLLALGCSLAQGNVISCPIAASDVPAWIASWSPDQAWTIGSRIELTNENSLLLRADFECRSILRKLAFGIKERNLDQVLECLEVKSVSVYSRWATQYKSAPKNIHKESELERAFNDFFTECRLLANHATISAWGEADRQMVNVSDAQAIFSEKIKNLLLYS